MKRILDAGRKKMEISQGKNPQLCRIYSER